MAIQQHTTQPLNRLRWRTRQPNRRIIATGVGVASLFLVSCATTPESELLPCGIDARPAVATDEMAILDLDPRRSRESLVRSLNGKPFCPQETEPCSSRRILIPPGRHAVIVSYRKSYSVLGPGGRDPVKFEFTARAGERYRVSVRQTGIIGWAYRCKLAEASTGRTLVDVEDCDRDELRYPAMNAVYDAFGGKQTYRDSRCYHRY